MIVDGGITGAHVRAFQGSGSLFPDATSSSDVVHGVALVVVNVVQPEFVTVGDDRTIRVFSLQTKALLRSSELDLGGRCVAYNHDGSNIAVGMHIVERKSDDDEAPVRGLTVWPCCGMCKNCRLGFWCVMYSVVAVALWFWTRRRWRRCTRIPNLRALSPT